MSIKNKLKNILKNDKEKERIYQEYDIEFKIENFLNWSYDNLNYSKEELLNFINKMAIWYEFKYPNNVLKEKKLNDLTCLKKSMAFKNINELLTEDLKNVLEELIDLISFDSLFDIKTFLNLLDDEELKFIKKPKFIEKHNNYINSLNLIFTSDGKLKQVLKFKEIDNTYEPYLNHDVKEVLPVIKEKELISNYDFFALNKACNDYQNKLLFKEKLLDIVLYKIIKNGIKKEGIKRGYLFAKEFKRDLSIPISYISDLNFDRNLINEYLKEGGNLDLICNNYYLSSLSLEFTLKELLNRHKEYTKEEIELQRKLILVLKNQLLLNEKELTMEQVKQKRLERKLTKSKTR